MQNLALVFWSFLIKRDFVQFLTVKPLTSYFTIINSISQINIQAGMPTYVSLFLNKKFTSCKNFSV